LLFYNGSSSSFVYNTGSIDYSGNDYLRTANLEFHDRNKQSTH